MTAGLGRKAQNLQEMGANFAVQGSEVDPAYRPCEPQPGDVFITFRSKRGLDDDIGRQLTSGNCTDCLN